MQQINSKVSGTVGSITRRPLLVPSYMGTGSITATQSGLLVTVDFGGVAHNIDSTPAGLISNVNTDVFLKVTSGAIIGDAGGSEVYNNITVTSPTQFTCLSRVSATVSTPQAVTQSLSAFKQHPTSGVTIPAGTLQIGSAVKLTALVLTPTGVVATRNIMLQGSTLASSNQGAPFWNDTSAVVTRVITRLIAVINILSTGSDPTFTLFDGTVGNSTTSQVKFNSGQNMDVANSITFCHYINFNSVALNDYALLLPVIAEILA
jgi:hypothetical protein